MKHLPPKQKPLSKLGLLSGLLLSTSIGLAAPTVSVKITAPTGSASKEFNSKIVKSMLYTPCVSASTDFGAVGTLTGTTVDNLFDQFLIKVTGSNSDEAKDGAYDFDLYFFIMDIGSNIFYQFSRTNAFGGAPDGVTITSGTGASTMVTTDKLLDKDNFSSATIDETIMGGTIWLDQFSLPQGTWMATAIVADEASVDFEDPTTWAAWDAVPFILGTPWLSATKGTTGTGTCD